MFLKYLDPCLSRSPHLEQCVPSAEVISHPPLTLINLSVFLHQASPGVWNSKVMMTKRERAEARGRKSVWEATQMQAWQGAEASRIACYEGGVSAFLPTACTMLGGQLK